MVPLSTMLIGGARSGKSSLGQRLVAATGDSVSVIVTAEAGDDEMSTRIEHHRSERPENWVTIEAPRLLVEAVEGIGNSRALLIDCVTFWVANRVMDDHPDEVIVDQAVALARVVSERTAATVIVSNEVGHGLVPGDPESRRFRDVHGRVNRILADACDQAFLVVAGQVLPLAPPEQHLTLDE